jgi:hypothetical protein
MAKSCPVPRNPIFTRSGDSVFENVTIWGKLCTEEANIVIKSPNGTKFKLVVDNAGNLSTQPLS